VLRLKEEIARVFGKQKPTALERAQAERERLRALRDAAKARGDTRSFHDAQLAFRAATTAVVQLELAQPRKRSRAVTPTARARFQ
jgi:hypothetical protein